MENFVSSESMMMTASSTHASTVLLLLSLLLPGLGAAAAAAVAADSDLGFELLMSGAGGGEVSRRALRPEEEGPGAIPHWLEGSLVENGGGRFEWPNPRVRRNLTNAGDGYAKLDVFTFAGGACTYSSKFARSAWFNNSVEIDDIAPSLTFGVPAPPRKSDVQGLPNVLAPNDNLAVNVIGIQDRVLMLSDQPGSIEFSLETLEFGKHQSSMPGPLCAFKDEPAIPLGMMASFGSAHPLWSGSSLDASGDAYGLLNVQRLSTLDPRREQLRLFKISAADQAKSKTSGNNPWLTRKTICSHAQHERGGLRSVHALFHSRWGRPRHPRPNPRGARAARDEHRHGGRHQGDGQKAHLCRV